MAEGKYYVYALLDTRKPGSYTFHASWGCVAFDFEPFYIGKGCRSRLKRHVAAVRRNPESVPYDHKGNKIRRIIAEGNVPVEFKVCDGLTEDLSFSREIELIHVIGSLVTLTNKTLGGDGTTGAVYTEERRAKLRKPRTEEAKARMREACKNRIAHKHTPEAKERIGLANIGKMVSDATRAKIVKNNTGRVVSEASREKNRLSNLGQKRSDAERAHMSITRRGVPKTKEHAEKVAAAQRGKPRPQTKCPHCHVVSSHGNIARWHGDNCKALNEVKDAE